MSGKSRKILNMLVTLNGVQYVLGRLRFNHREFSYFFTYPTDSNEKQLNLDTGEETPRVEHVTWHDGQIHIKLENNEVVEVFEYDGLLLSDPPVLTPVYVESFYFKGEPCFIKAPDFTPWSGSVAQEVLSLENTKGFSLLYFLAPSDHSTDHILVNFQFKDIPDGLSEPPLLMDLCDMNHRPGRIQVWENWDLVVIATPFMQETLSPIPESLGSVRLPNYKNVPAALTDLMLQANGLSKSSLKK